MVDKTTEVRPPGKKPRWKRLLQNTALVMGSMLVGVALLEIVLRFAGYGHVEIYAADPNLYWRLQPNQDCFTKVDHKPVHINAEGTRGPDFSPAKPPDTFRVLSVGDSRTFGWGLADDETYSRRLERMLESFHAQFVVRPVAGSSNRLARAFRDARRVEVINSGVNAWSYQQMAIYLKRDATAFAPDIAVLGEANLWTQFSERNSPEFVKSFLLRVRLKNLLRRSAVYDYIVEHKMREVYERTRVKFIPVDPAQDALFKEQQASDPDAMFREAIAGFCGIAATNHIEPLLLFLPTEDQLTSTNEGRVLPLKRAVSRERGVTLCDVTDRLRQEKPGLYLTGDPVHLNARGNEIIAEALFETVSNMIVR